MQRQRRGLILIVSAPSGGGKTTIVKELIKQMSGVHIAVTCTSRLKREGEVDGKDYYFFRKEEFKEKLCQGFFWEHVNYCDNFYGVPKELTLSEIEKGKDVILNIESEGMRAVKSTNLEDVVTIFVMPKSKSELRKRLECRGDSKETIERRLGNVENEIKNYGEYDYIVFNDKLSDAVDEIKSIVLAERLKTKRKAGIEDFMTKGFFEN